MQPENNVSASLLNEIITEVNKMDWEQQRMLLTQLRKDAILQEVKRLDSVKGPAKQNSMTDEQTDAYISEQRKLRHDQ